MLPRLEILIDLLHRSPDAALATQSVAVAGFPYASALPFATDERHRPILLLSSLAEHSHNLAADPRASLMVRRPLDGGDMARATVVGRVVPIEPSALLVARYLRYQPFAEQLLQFADFRFHRFEVVQVRIIGGFAQAAWLPGERLTDGPSLTLDQESQAIEALRPLLPAGIELLGIDSFGLDLAGAGGRRRATFAAGAVTADALEPVARRTLQGLAAA